MAINKEEVLENSEGNFQKLMVRLVEDPSCNVILIGEKHGISPTDDALIASIDILAASGRPIFVVLERLTQQQNEFLDKAFKEKGIPSAKDIAYSDYVFYHFFLKNNIKIFGIENEKSLPFINQSQDDSQVVAKMGKYAGSIERIVNANEVFSEFINSLLKKHHKINPLIIFMGGASHPLQALKEDETVLDTGIKNRIPNSIAVIVDYKENDIFKTQYKYKFSEHNLYGITDYYVATDNYKVYQDAFDSKADKERYLIDLIHEYLSSYKEYKKREGKSSISTLKSSIKNIIAGFNASEGKTLPFNKTFELIDRLQEKKDSSASIFTKLVKKTNYKKDFLQKAIAEDLSSSSLELKK